MLGGTHSFGPGGYGGTDVEHALPVIAGSRAQTQELTNFLPRLTALGEKHPVLEGLSGYFPGPGGRRPKDELPRLPPLRGCVTVSRAKPTADVLAVHPLRRNESGPLVVLAVQRYGVGRSAAFTPDTTWQWYMLPRASGTEGAYSRLWGQMIRWLAGADTKSREARASVLVQLAPSRTAFKSGEAAIVHATVRGAKVGEGAGAVAGKAVPPGRGDEPITLALRAVGEKGHYQAAFKPPKEGTYHVEVAASDKDDRVLATDRLPLVSLKPEPGAKRAETDPARLKPDRELLTGLAEATGGAHHDVGRLADLIAQIRRRLADEAERRRPAARETVYPRYDSLAMTLLFLLFIALMTAEWILRRSWQLR
jgi:hypothetical protein